MKPIYAPIAVVATLVLSCGSPDTTHYTPVADAQQIMLHVLEPAAEVYWDAVGIIMDLEGTTEIYPRSEEEWEAVENAAYVIAESGNLLMVQGRALEVEDDAWMNWSAALIDVGRQAIEAAESRSRDAVFDMGAEVYYVCTGCHATYALETIRPADLEN